jgi:hypothetical protein
MHQVPAEGPVPEPPHRAAGQQPAAALPVPHRGGGDQQREQRADQRLRAAVRAVPEPLGHRRRPERQRQVPAQDQGGRRAEGDRRAPAAPHRHRGHRAQQELRGAGRRQVVQQPLAQRGRPDERPAQPDRRPGRAGADRQQAQRPVAAPPQEPQQGGGQQVEPGLGAERPGGRVPAVHLGRRPGLEQRQRPEGGGERQRRAQQQGHRQGEPGGQQVQRPDPGEAPPVEHPARNPRPGGRPWAGRPGAVRPGQYETGEHEEEGDPVPAVPDQRTEQRQPVVLPAQVVEHHQQGRPEAQPGQRGQRLAAGGRGGGVHRGSSCGVRHGWDPAQRLGAGRSHGSWGGKNRSGARSLGSCSSVEPTSEGCHLGRSTE